MSSARIIRPRNGNGNVATGPVEVTLEQFRTLSQEIIQEARCAVRAAEEKKTSVDEEITTRRKSAEAEIEALQRTMEQELEARRNLLEQEIEEWRRRGFAEGEKTGRGEGARLGQDEGFRKGFEEGYREGLEKGIQEARQMESQRIRQETQTLTESIGSLAAGLSSQRGELLQAARRDLIRLAMEVAKKIVHREVRQVNDLFIDNVRRAVGMVFLNNRIIIQLHPEDQAVAQKHISGIFESLGRFDDFEVQGAEGIDRGGCRILTGTGQVDLNLQSQFEIIGKSLEEAVSGEEIFAAAVGAAP